MYSKTILCLDGGGSRGRFSFGIVNLIAQNSESKMSTLFDAIIGVSVGAWIGAAVALGMLDDKKSQVQRYHSFVAQIADTFRSLNPVAPAIFSPRYDGCGKRALLHRVFGSHRLKDVICPLAVVCVTITGKIKLFCSWKAEDQDLFIADILDATSAAPVYFPPVLINDVLMVDGGVLANKPLHLAYLIAYELFPEYAKQKRIKMLSIGTHATCEMQVEPERCNEMGIVAWISGGIFDIMTGIADDSWADLMKILLTEENFMRVFCDCGSIKLDDMSESAIHKIHDSITQTWNAKGNELLSFLNQSTC